jgi:hypothetical protein
VAESSKTSLGFTKILNPHLTRDPQDDPQGDDDITLTPNRLVALPSVSGYSTVFLCGPYPGFIMKTSHSIARFHKMAGEPVKSLCPFNVTTGVEDGFLYYDTTVSSLFEEADYRG